MDGEAYILEAQPRRGAKSLDEFSFYVPRVRTNVDAEQSAPDEETHGQHAMSTRAKKRKREATAGTSIMRQDGDDTEEDDGIPCAECGSRESTDDTSMAMLRCSNGACADEGKVGHHLECLTPPLQAMPEGDWYCPKCRPPSEEVFDVPPAEGNGGAGPSTGAPSTDTPPAANQHSPSSYRGVNWPLENQAVFRVRDGRTCYEYSLGSNKHNLSPEAYGAVREQFAQFNECASFNLPAAAKEKNATTQKAGEDSHSSSSCHLGVMDGVTGGNAEDPDSFRICSALKSTWLAEECKKAAKRLATCGPHAGGPNEVYNHGYRVLQMAANQAIRTAQDNRAMGGSTTALVASTCKGQLHVASVGDCRLAVLRMHPADGLQVELLTEPTYHPIGQNQPKGTEVPVQLTLTRPELSEWRNQGLVDLHTVEVKENDIVVAGSDGFFDNLQYADAQGKDDAERIKSRIVQICEPAILDAGEDDDEGELLVERVGNDLYSAAKGGMHDGPRAREPDEYCVGRHAKPDDLTLLVARVSFHSAPLGAPPATEFVAGSEDGRAVVSTRRAETARLKNYNPSTYGLRSTSQQRYPSVEGTLEIWRFKYV